MTAYDASSSLAMSQVDMAGAGPVYASFLAAIDGYGTRIYDVAYAAGYAAGFAAGEAAHVNDFTNGYASGYVDGYNAGYADGYAAGIAAAPLPDAVAPTISVVSPTPGVAVGAPGGFPRAYSSAKITPIVLDVTDVDPGVQYFVVIARFYADAEDENPTEEVVYRRSNFRGLYVKGSFATPIADGIRLSVLRVGGWPSNSTGSSVGHIAFAVDVLDADGNLSA